MPYELRENSFLLFKNHGKEKNPKAPDYKGEGLIGGRAHEAAIWVKEGARGEFFSMILKPKEQHQEPKPKTEDDPKQESSKESDLPF